MTPDYLNLIHDPWIPVRRQSGAISTIRPAQIVEDLTDDPVIAFEWPRADFRIASYEFLIGLLATAFPATDRRGWLRQWRTPPTVQDLDDALAPLSPAFFLDGPGPRFLQDFSELEAGSEPVERLLINAPGESTIKKNTDLFVHRDQSPSMGRAAAAIALFALQSWAPSGGAGNMTGLRGGGPLLTLAIPRERASLWEVIWANTPCGIPVENEALPRVFPWLAPTISSGKTGRKIFPGDPADVRQCWWGMPRRIRLDFTDAEDGVCAMTGQPDTVLVTGWRQRPYGPDYAGWTGEPYGLDTTAHPLTPRYRQKPETEWLSVHPQPGGVTYRHWAGVAVMSGDGNRAPASSIATWQGVRAPNLNLSREPRLLAAGYDMDNMKARGFVESEMPLPGAATPERQAEIDRLARTLVEAAAMVSDMLRRYVREALFGKAPVGLDVVTLSDVQQQFITDTEDGFFALLGRASKSEVAGGDADAPLRMEWLRTLSAAARSGFDSVVVLTPETGMTEAQRTARCRRSLRAALTLSSKGEGVKLAEVLGLPAATPPASSGRKTSS